MFIINSLEASGALQPPKEEGVFNGKTKKGLHSSLNGLCNQNLNMNGEFIVVWLDKDLIQVSLMPTN